MKKHIMVAAILLLATTVQPSPRLFHNSSYFDANSILMMTTNYGLYGYDVGNVFGYSHGTFYPYTGVDNIYNGTQIKSPLYSAGLWLGGKVAGVTRVSTSDFGSEYWPGPMSGGTFVSDADTVSAYRVYKIYADSAEGNPNPDYLNWPTGQGAPTDGLGHPLVRGSQTVWLVFNDANPARHNAINGSTSTLGIEIQQVVWGTNLTGYERVIYLEYRLFNRGGNAITNFYMTPFFDPDLGGAQDDLTGCDTLISTIYCYNATNSDAWYGATPPALGIRFLYGPAVASIHDSAYFFGTWIHGYRNLPMSSFVSYFNGDDPQSAAESYNLMQGLKRNGSPLANGTTFSFPGDPVAGTGDLNSTPGNPHFVASFGPIDFLPGDSQSFVLKLVIGQGADRLTSITDMRSLANTPDSITTGVEEPAGPILPRSFQLGQNHPNPFNPSTVIEYSLASRSDVRLVVVDLLGRVVRTLVAQPRQAAGSYQVIWDGRAGDGAHCSSGVYFYRLETNLGSETRKMILLK
ncbi:MAG: FlgD immunoglobulin-like domain containing protein [Candidatus Zixiibacteriota bacterium]